MLRWRVAAAAMILTPLIALLVADFHWNFGTPGIWLILPGLAIALMAANEVLDLLRSPGFRPVGWPVYVGTALVFLAACAPMIGAPQGISLFKVSGFGQHGLVLLAVATAVGLAFVAEMRRFAPPQDESQRGAVVVPLALSILTTVYIGVSLAFAALIRQFHSNAWGMAALVSIVVVVKVSDTGAYFIGKSLGRHKMSPILSPKKTVEGAIGGLVAAVIASWLYFRFLAPLITGDTNYIGSMWGVVIYGLLLGTVGMMGDLAESLIKRDVSRKDSSSWLPGLGGVLDVMDSLFFAMPAAYACWAAGIVGPA